jgi:hypothetical protein
VQAHAGAALVNFAEDCPKNILAQYLDAIIAKLEQVLSAKFQELVEKGTKLGDFHDQADAKWIVIWRALRGHGHETNCG